MLDSAYRVRLFIADPQPLVSAGLEHFFGASEAFDVAGAAEYPDLPMLQTIRPDVILLGYEHGTDDLCDSIAAARVALPSTKIFVLSCHTHPELLEPVLRAGASGYATKAIFPGDLINAVKAVAAGRTYIDRRVDELARRKGRRIRGNSHNALSERETEIVRLIAEGRSNREISAALGLSEKTIKNHISRIFAKLHITARTQAVVHAIKVGIA